MDKFKIIHALLVVFFIIFTAQLSFSEKLTIKDYFEKLPQEYITHYGDYGPDECTKLFDVKNGYMAIIQHQYKTEITIFEIRLFKKKNMDAVIVISNRQQDPECVSYETFWLEYKKNEWENIAPDVLPSSLLTKSKRVSSCFHFKLPRYVTFIKFNLIECDIEPFDTFTVDEKRELLKVKEVKQIRWDKKTSKFMVAE
jgi:hypothetical protein